MSQVVQVAGPRRAPRNKGPAFKGIAPGAGAAAPVAFGSTRRKAQKKKKQRSNGTRSSRGQCFQCWNAFSPQHLALPRAVGEYTVTRGTKQISTSDPLIIIGTWQHSNDKVDVTTGSGRNWSDVVALGCEDLTKKPSESAWFPYKMPMLTSGMGEHSQIVPSACSVQIMNGNALQTTSGMLYIGKLKVQPQYAGDDVDTAATIANNFVSYMAPRLCAAAKLALRGVQVDAHPLNMNRMADFTQIYRGFTNSTGPWPENLTPTGMTPIVIYNPDQVTLNLLVCHEYRTRFELFNPACASHKFHPPSTDNVWADGVKKMCEIGAGVLDIADVVAKSGVLESMGALSLGK